jgi:Arc/MetJ-type ribon-helix-helix transcriptional regulator
MPRQTSIQLTEETERQIEALKRAGYGSFTDIVRIAVDRMAGDRGQAKHTDNLMMPPGFEIFLPVVGDLNEYDLDDLAEAVHVRRLQLMADHLRANGFGARIGGINNQQFRYICVYSPDESQMGEWATLEECRQLLDTVRNLSPDEAFARWRTRIEPMPTRPYTRADAIADVKRERTEAQRRYQAGEISAEDLRLMWAAARDFLDYTEN